MALREYDPGDVSLTFGAIQPTSFFTGTFIVAEMMNDAFALVTGASGDTTRVHNRNRNGTVTLTLMHEDPANALLFAIHRQDRLFKTGVLPILIEDVGENGLVTAESAWIRKIPNITKADTASPREWIFDCADLEIIGGGADE
jgi:hypothetical protein